ncbi:MAG: hypothetical protein ACHP6I_00700 [Rickettsiales bacterium]
MLDKNSIPDIESEVLPNLALASFIPIVSHYDPNTLITKDSDLIQTIEISGYNDINDFDASVELRTYIREALIHEIPGTNFAFYIHNIRSRKNLMPKGTLPFGFAANLNDKWCKKNNWDKQLVNTIYLSIVIQAPAASRFYVPRFLRHLDENVATLTNVVDNICKSLIKFGARRLTMVKSARGYMSEPLFFYHHLTHLDQKRTPVPIRDLSEYLASMQIDFHFNWMKIQDLSGEQFCAIFSFKDLIEFPNRVLDRFTQLGMQFIITQAGVFYPASEAKKRFVELKERFEMSKATELFEATGAQAMLNSDKGRFADYCKLQTTILIHSDSKKFFQSKIHQAIALFKEMGINVVREDFNMPRCFWAQLPGNFKYLCRLEEASTNIAGSFCNIFSKSSGNYKGSKWGPPISLLRREDGAPFFFNFHDNESNGNTVIIGPKGSGKTILTRFLLTQALRLQPRIIYIDLEGATAPFTEAIGGKVVKYQKGEPLPFKINPLQAANFDKNSDVYREWLIGAIYPQGENSPQIKEFFDVLAKKLIEEDAATNKLEVIANLINSSTDAGMISSFNALLGSEHFKNYFTQGEDELDFFESDNTICLGLAEMLLEENFFESYLGILLKKLPKILDSKPTVIAMNKAMHVYNNRSFCHQFGTWLDDLKAKNAIALVTSERPNNFREIEDFYKDFAKYGTRIFFSDKFADKYFRRAFGLSDVELYKIKSYSADRRAFLIKQGDISTVLSLQLNELGDELKTLVG